MNLQTISRILKFSPRILITATVFSNATLRRKEARKTDLAPVDFVIYAVSPHVVRISVAVKQIFAVHSPDPVSPVAASRSLSRTISRLG